jgi:hypothetical protein
VNVELEGKYELLIIRNKFLKNTLEMTNKILNKAQPLFSKELSKRLGYEEETKPEKNQSPPKQENESKERNAPSKPGTDEIIEAKKDNKDENLKGVFKKIASKIHPDKLENLPQFEKDYKTSLFEKARMSLDSNDYYGIVEVAKELDIEPPPPNRKQIDLMKKTNEGLENKVNEMQKSVLWNWYYSDEEARELLMSKYVERLQEMHAGT